MAVDPPEAVCWYLVNRRAFLGRGKGRWQTPNAVGSDFGPLRPALATIMRSLTRAHHVYHIPSAAPCRNASYGRARFAAASSICWGIFCLSMACTAW
jgi:hypothetical protein